MNKQITVSAPGKLMLLGEHAVVYGRPCIVTAVNQRMRVTVELIDKPILELDAPDVNITGYKKSISELGRGEIPKGAKFVEIALYNFYNNYKGYIRSGIKVASKSEFSPEFGFGSSSAVTVCVLKALSQLTGAKLSNKELFKLAYKTVLDIQGKGSGFDVATAIYGGTLYFVTGGKIIESLLVDSLPLVVGFSGIKADTVSLINEVAKRSEKYPQIIENVYNQIERLVNQSKIALLNKDWPTLGELMNFNESLLATLGVESQKLTDMIYAARSAGAYGAKLSGAGMGDCMITLVPKGKKKAVEQAIEQVGGQIININVRVEGVKLQHPEGVE